MSGEEVVDAFGGGGRDDRMFVQARFINEGINRGKGSLQSERS